MYSRVRDRQTSFSSQCNFRQSPRLFLQQGASSHRHLEKVACDMGLFDAFIGKCHQESRERLVSIQKAQRRDVWFATQEIYSDGQR